jgi:hypothetical protein
MVDVALAVTWLTSGSWLPFVTMCRASTLTSSPGASVVVDGMRYPARLSVISRLRTSTSLVFVTVIEYVIASPAVTDGIGSDACGQITLPPRSIWLTRLVTPISA